MALINRTENIIIAGATAVLTTALLLVIVHFATIKPLERQIQHQNEVIIELAKIEKYRYEIRNDFDKIKSANSQIVIDLDNKLNSLVVTPGNPVKKDSIFKKKSFFDKLIFWNK